MNNAWPYEFRERMRRFEAAREPRPGEAPVSIKIRVSSGCFHREHSPRAYELIDLNLQRLAASDAHLVFEEHESGPEILVYVSLVAAGLGLAAQVINLITAIIRARSEGIKKGDHPSHPLQLIVRRVHDADGFREEQVLTIGHTEAVDEVKLEKQLKDALHKLLKEDSSKIQEKTPARKSGGARQKDASNSRRKKKR